MPVEDLSSLKDDMIAFISGHGLRLMNAYVPEDIPSVLFEGDDPDAWKDFVEHAKSAAAPFVTMSEVTLEPEDIATLVSQLQDPELPRDATGIEDAQDLLQHEGRIGYLQLGFSCGGCLYLYETATEWYDQFQQLLDTVNGLDRFLSTDDEE